jgi:hypothetical protein
MTERVPARRVDPGRIGTHRKENLAGSDIARGSRDHQRGPAIKIDLVGIEASLQQGLDRPRIPLLKSETDGSLTDRRSSDRRACRNVGHERMEHAAPSCCGVPRRMLERDPNAA